jgi:hypothetical protein
MLLESLVIVWFFMRQGLFKNSSRIPVILAFLFFCAWLTETFIWKSKYGHNTKFQLFYAFFVVLMSVSSINRLLVSGGRNLHTDALFLICTAFILYFTVTILVYAFLLYGITKSPVLFQNIFFIKLSINFFSNLTFAYAVLRIPKKIAFHQAKPA